MFNKYFDHIYVINLDDSKDRMENTRKELESLDIEKECCFSCHVISS